MMFSVDLLKVRVFHREDSVKNSNVFALGMFSCAREMLCFTMRCHDVGNALVKVVMWKSGCLCVLLLQYLH